MAECQFQFSYSRFCEILHSRQVPVPVQPATYGHLVPTYGHLVPTMTEFVCMLLHLFSKCVLKSPVADDGGPELFTSSKDVMLLPRKHCIQLRLCSGTLAALFNF